MDDDDLTQFLFLLFMRLAQRTLTSHPNIGAPFWASVSPPRPHFSVREGSFELYPSPCNGPNMHGSLDKFPSN
jgi:hypothetical protein